MLQGKMPMRKMKGAKAPKGSDVQEKAIKELKKKPGGKLVSHPEMTPQQSKEVAPDDLRG